MRFRARFDLPNLRDKAYVFIGRQNERELLTDQSETFTREQLLLEERQREDQTGFAGLGVALRKNIDFRVGVRGGLKFFTQARYRKQWALSEQDRIEFRETIFWNNKDKFGSTTALDYEHAFTPKLSLRTGRTRPRSPRRPTTSPGAAVSGCSAVMATTACCPARWS